MLLAEGVLRELDLARRPDYLLAELLFTRLSIGLCNVSCCRLAVLRLKQELLVLVVAPCKHFALFSHSKALLVTCVDLADLFLFQGLHLGGTLLNGDDMLFTCCVLATVAIQLVDLDLPSLAQAELAKVVSAPGVNLPGRV